MLLHGSSRLRCLFLPWTQRFSNFTVSPKSSLHFEIARKWREWGREWVSEVCHMLRDALPRLTSTDPVPNPSSRRCWAPMSLSFQLWRVAAWFRPGQCRLTGPWQGDCEPWGGWERIYINCFGDHQPFPSSIYRLSFARSLSLSPAAWCFIIKGFYCAVILPVVNQCNLSTGHRCGDAYGEIQSNNTQTVLTPVFLHCKTWWKETGINRSTTVPLIQALPQESIKAFGTKSHYCNNTVRRRWKK